MVQNFRRLEVWGKAHALALNVRRASRDFQRSGCAPLKAQITRAAESVPSNIVEGAFCSTQKEFARFLDISIKSTGEVEYQLQLARDYGLLRESTWRSLTNDTIQVRRMLVGLRSRVLRDLSQSSCPKTESRQRPAHSPDSSEPRS